MKAELKSDGLHIWRDDKDSIEIRVTGKSEKALKGLETQLNNKSLKFYPAIEQINRMKNSIIEYRNNQNSNFIPGMPNSIKSVGSLDIHNWEKNKSDSRDKKDPPSWLNFVDSDIKKKKNSQDLKDKLWKEGDPGNNPAFYPYSDDIYDGYAKGFVRFWKANPNYEAPSYESKTGLSILVKGGIWGWHKKLKNRKAKGEDVNMGAWHGRMALFAEKAKNALIRVGAPPELVIKGSQDDESFEDDYLTGETNNKIFSGLPKKEREELYKLMNLSQREIDGIERSIGIEKNNFSDAGSILTFGDILKESLKLYEDFYNLAKLQELINQEERHFKVSNLAPSVRRPFEKNGIEDIFIGQSHPARDLHTQNQISMAGYKTYGKGGAVDEDFNDIFIKEGPQGGHPSNVNYGNFYWAIENNMLKITGRTKTQDKQIISHLPKVMSSLIRIL